MRLLALTILIILPATAIASLRGNLNLSYQGNPSTAATPAVSTFGQILNLYLNDRIFYSNDLTLGALISHSKISNRTKGDFRTRYTMNMNGYRYTLYSSYSPYTIFNDNSPSQKVRIFQAAINIKPRLVSNLTATYSSDREFTTDNPQTTNISNRSWNMATQISRNFGNFRGVYQRQDSRFTVGIPQKQVQQTVNFGYDIAKQAPWKLDWSASYNLIGSRNRNPDNTKDNNLTHNGAIQAGRAIGQWLTLSAASSGRTSKFQSTRGNNRFQELFANASANFKLRHNISFIVLRGYSINKIIAATTTRSINDYVNLSSAINFGLLGGADGRFSVSRGIYYKSVLGPSTIDNSLLAIELPVYRQTNATINLGVSHNSKTFSGLGKYQITRTLDINSLLTPKMSVDINYQSTLTASRVTFLRSDNDNLSLSMTHTLKPNFNYSLGYRRTVIKSTTKNIIWSIEGAVNYIISNNLSLTASYSRRDLGLSTNQISRGVEDSFQGSLTWNVSSRSSVTANYAVSGLNTSNRTQSYGGFFATSF